MQAVGGYGVLAIACAVIRYIILIVFSSPYSFFAANNYIFLVFFQKISLKVNAI